MDLGLKDKVAIVTGSSRGLGFACAYSLGMEGAQVVLCGRNEEQLKTALSNLHNNGISAVGITIDITQAEDVEKLYDFTMQSYKQVDILINNVGGSIGSTSFENLSDDEWSRSLDLNLFGTIRLTRLVVPQMKDRNWGRIICIGSIFGREYGGSMTYMTSKAALTAFTKHLSMQLAPFNVLVNTVHPGSIAHPGGGWQKRLDEDPEGMRLFITNNLPLGRFGKSNELGDFVCFLASERASLITGTAYNIDGGQSKSLL
tara:strand:- start:88 stop:861 length:774 start_codon:yes stop_codon:yes gene_type:complete